MVQDREGFIWIGTADGLARYDGRQFSVFRHREQPNTLLENNISRLQPLANGDFLLQTNTGDFQYVDPETERFTTFLPLSKQGRRKIDVGWLTPNGRTFWGLWRGEKIQCFDQKFKPLHTWDERTLGIATKTLHSLTPASNGRVYAHHDNGLIELDGRTGKHRLLPFKGQIAHWLNGVMPVVDWEPVAERPNGEIMVIGRDYLLVLNTKTGQYRELKFPTKLIRNGAYAMRVFANGKVYISMGNRLYELLPDDRFLLAREWEKPQGEQASFGVPYLIDRSGVLWVHTQAGDLKGFVRQVQPFHTSTYRTEWKSDVIEVILGVKHPNWVSSGGDSWTRFTSANGRLWFIDVATLYQCAPDQHRFKLSQTSSFTSGDSCHFKIALKSDQQAHLWVYGNENGGLTEMDAAGHVKRFWPNSLVPQSFEKRGLDVADIQPMGSVVWLASYQGKGLYKYDLRQKKIVEHLLHNSANNQSLPTNHLLGLLTDPFEPTRILWIGTLGGGLTRFDTQTRQFRTFTEADGLPDNTINSLQRDLKGFIWIATTKGLVRLDPRSFQMRVFTQADGLLDNEFIFATSAKLPDGRLAFGSRTGMIWFDPASIREQTSQTPVVLSALRINNVLMEANTPASPLLNPINSQAELTLDHTQNFLTFEFAGLDYARPDQIQYRHRLLGVDHDWINTGTQNTANYTQLRPNDYIFEVTALNPNGQWSRQVKRLAISVKPPFWSTWWAYACYALVFGGVVTGFIRLRISRIRERQEMALKQREAEQLKTVDELKNRFFSNITHEFRTPLSLILSPTEKLLRETKHDESTRQTLTTVHRNAGQLLNLVNQLLDLSKLEAGNMVVSPTRGNVAQCIEQIVEPFHAIADHKGIALHIRTGNAQEDHLFDADKWQTIITNLVANALKFTLAGEVTLDMAFHTQTSVRLTVADTGIGIPAEKLPHIFDRFYQVDDTRTRTYEGSGIGLSLVKELVDVLGGKISVESQPGKGTTFTLELPVLPTVADKTTPTLVTPALHQPTVFAAADPSNDPPHTHSADVPLVLVIEDNVELLRFIADELSPAYRVLTARNGREGWHLAQTELPDSIISDVMMPDMDGYELTRLVKTSAATNHIALMLLTARASYESRMEGLQHGADDYLTKPFHLDELHQRLHNLLARQKTLRDYYFQQFTQPGEAFSPETINNEFLRQLHSAINTHLDDSTFGVEELSRMVGMSRRTLNRKLATVANQSANDIIRQYRLKRAAEFLRAGHNVSETAYMIGYDSPAHFSLIFKDFFQKTPTEYTQQ
ncbi:hypothetical protein GCM10027085_10860 [Spirosoma aerophilum]